MKREYSVSSYLLLVIALLTWFNMGLTQAGEDAELALPDIIIRQSDLLDNDIRVTGGRTLLRLSNGTANAGVGPLHLYGVTPGNEDGTFTTEQQDFYGIDEHGIVKSTKTLMTHNHQRN